MRYPISQSRRLPPIVLSAIALAILFLAPATFAQSAREQAAGVRNFGRVTEHFFRGGEVTPDGVGNLARMGVRTIIDLRDDPSADEPAACRRHGIRYLNFRMSGHESLDDEAVDRILSILRTAKEPVYVHCTAGKHRTGAIAALYRIRVQGWPKERAWAEEQSYGFGAPAEHPELYAYVYAPRTKPVAPKGLSGDAGYVPLVSAVRRARAGGGSGDVLKIDLEWDKVRLVPTWDVTFSSGIEYEIQAVSGQLLGKKPKLPAKLAVFSPLSLNGAAANGLVTFQEVLRKVEASRGQTVLQMELKHIRGQAPVYEVDLADGATLVYDAATGSPSTAP